MQRSAVATYLDRVHLESRRARTVDTRLEDAGKRERELRSEGKSGGSPAYRFLPISSGGTRVSLFGPLPFWASSDL